MAEPSVVVVGAGIMGTSTAFWLHQRGWDVTLLDAGPVPNHEGSSGGVHRLIRTTYGNEVGYTRMVTEAYAAWDELWDVLGRRLLTHTGMLAVDTAAGTFGADSRAALEQLGLPFELLDHDRLVADHPQFRIPEGATALFTPDAHFLRAREIVAALAAWLREQRVTIRAKAAAAGVDTAAGTVTLDDGEVLRADRVVVAAGPWTADLGGIDTPPLTPSRQVVVDLQPPSDLRSAWASGPAFLLQPCYGVPPRDGLPLKVGDHAFSLTGHPDDDRGPTDDEVAALMDVAREALVDLDRYELLRARVCYYTFHDDERFVVEPRGERGALLAGFSGHGFKFGSVIGQRVAAALDEDADWAEVSHWAAGQAS